MALIVEDGTGKSDAESYASVADAAAQLIYHQDESKWAVLTADQKEDALRAASEYLDLRYRWYGQVVNDTQALQWPRTRVYNSHGVLLKAGVVPVEVKKAACYLAVTSNVEEGLYNIAYETGAVKQYFTDGLNLLFDPKTTEAAQIRGKRLVHLELLLKNLGTFVDVNWIEVDKTTVVKA